MKRYVLFFLLLFIPVASIAAVKSVVTIKITGLDCQYCTYQMKYKLSKLLNIEKVDVNSNIIRLIMPSVKKSDLLNIEKIIDDSGYLSERPIMSETD